MRCFAAGTTLAQAASRTWGTTASGQSSWRSTCRFPYSIEAQTSHSCEINDQVSTIKSNDFSFPYANRVCFKFAAHGQWPALKLYWYDGGMRPYTPDELLEDGKSIPATGSLFVGDKGIILNDEIIPAKKMQAYRTSKGLPTPPADRGRRGGYGMDNEWLTAFKGGAASQGNFLNAANCSEAIALAGAAIRYSGKIFNEDHCAPALLWDKESMKFTNIADANQYLTREYRQGWELTSALGGTAEPRSTLTWAANVHTSGTAAALTKGGLHDCNHKKRFSQAICDDRCCGRYSMCGRPGDARQSTGLADREPNVSPPAAD